MCSLSAGRQLSLSCYQSRTRHTLFSKQQSACQHTRCSHHTCHRLNEDTWSLLDPGPVTALRARPLATAMERNFTRASFVNTSCPQWAFKCSALNLSKLELGIRTDRTLNVRQSIWRQTQTLKWVLHLLWAVGQDNQLFPSSSGTKAKSYALHFGLDEQIFMALTGSILMILRILLTFLIINLSN